MKPPITNTDAGPDGHSHGRAANAQGRDSLLCAGAGQRLGAVSLCLLALWLTVFWAMK